MSSRLTDQGWVVEPDVVDERKDLPRLTGAQIDVINARIAAGSGEFPTGTQIVRSDDGVTLTLQGVGVDAQFELPGLDETLVVTKVGLAAATGAAAVGAGSPVATPYLQTVSDILNGSPVSLLRFIAASRHSAIRGFSSTFNAAPDIGVAFGSGARRLVADYGLYNLESTIFTSLPVALEGAGDGTIFNQVGVTARASFHFKSTAEGQYVEGVSLRNFVMQCLTATFAEQQHLVICDGVRDARFEGLKAYGFRGDALYFGSGTGVEVRHNERVYVGRCVFDGINNENRNAISVIDVDGMVIESSDFVRCTRSNMPGPIDFEPNANAWHILRNIVVRQNRFRLNGGNVGEIAVPVPGVLSDPPHNFTFEANESDGYVGTGSFVLFNTQRTTTESSEDSQVRVIGNRARNGYRPFVFLDGKGVDLSRNVWQDFKAAAILGSTTSATNMRDVQLNREKFTRVGSVGGVGLAVYSVNRLQIQDTQLIDCGNGNAGSYALDFGQGTSAYVDISGLTVASPTGKTLVAIQKEATHTFTPNTNKFYRGNVGTLTNNFQAHESDSLETSYLPVAGGSTVTGAGSYTTRLGRAKRIGTKAFVRIYIACDVNHSATVAGILQVSLPWPAKQGGTMDTHVPISVIGVPAGSSVSQYGRLIQAVTEGGVLGAIRCFTNASGSDATILVPNTAFVFMANFSYEIAEGY